MQLIKYADDPNVILRLFGWRFGFCATEFYKIFRIRPSGTMNGYVEHIKNGCKITFAGVGTKRFPITRLRLIAPIFIGDKYNVFFKGKRIYRIDTGFLEYLNVYKKKDNYLIKVKGIKGGVQLWV
jgi:hypothetical protein